MLFPEVGDFKRAFPLNNPHINVWVHVTFLIIFFLVIRIVVGHIIKINTSVAMPFAWRQGKALKTCDS